MQQINLYLPELRPRKDHLSLRNVLMFAGAFVLFLIVSTVTASLQNSQREQRIRELTEEKIATEQKMAALDRKPVEQQRAELEQRINAARNSLVNRQRLIEVLQGETLGDHEGFSAQIGALAALVPAGVALERFTLTAGGRDIRFSGKSRTTDNIPLFLNRLREHAAFEQSGFGELTIHRNPPWYEFSVNHADPEESAAKPLGRRP